MTAPEPEAYARAFAEQVGLPALTDAQFNAVLDVAAEAAHASARQAAPVCCWLAASAGLTPEEALEMARAVTEATSG